MSSTIVSDSEIVSTRTDHILGCNLLGPGNVLDLRLMGSCEGFSSHVCWSYSCYSSDAVVRSSVNKTHKVDPVIHILLC